MMWLICAEESAVKEEIENSLALHQGLKQVSYPQCPFLWGVMAWPSPRLM